MKNKSTAKKQFAQTSSQWETTHTGAFAPSWRPEADGEDVIFRPTGNIRKLPKMKKIAKEGYAIECQFFGGQSENFYAGDSQVSLNEGDLFTILSSHNLNDETALFVEEKKSVRLSKLAQQVMKAQKTMRIVFGGVKKISGGRKIKNYVVQAPKGLRELTQKSA